MRRFYVFLLLVKQHVHTIGFPRGSAFIARVFETAYPPLDASYLAQVPFAVHHHTDTDYRQSGRVFANAPSQTSLTIRNGEVGHSATLCVRAT